MQQTDLTNPYEAGKVAAKLTFDGGLAGNHAATNQRTSAMTSRFIVPALALFIAGAAFPAYAATVPCEEMLGQLRAKEASAPAPDANKAAYEDLKTKGIERCNADDDKRADDFFMQAMDLLAK